jgi:hypothetical protein
MNIVVVGLHESHGSHTGHANEKEAASVERNTRVVLVDDSRLGSGLGLGGAGRLGLGGAGARRVSGSCVVARRVDDGVHLGQGVSLGESGSRNERSSRSAISLLLRKRKGWEDREDDG